MPQGGAYNDQKVRRDRGSRVLPGTCHCLRDRVRPHVVAGYPDCAMAGQGPRNDDGRDADDGLAAGDVRALRQLADSTPMREARLAFTRGTSKITSENWCYFYN